MSPLHTETNLSSGHFLILLLPSGKSIPPFPFFLNIPIFQGSYGVPASSVKPSLITPTHCDSPWVGAHMGIMWYWFGLSVIFLYLCHFSPNYKFLDGKDFTLFCSIPPECFINLRDSINAYRLRVRGIVYEAAEDQRQDAQWVAWCFSHY